MTKNTKKTLKRTPKATKVVGKKQKIAGSGTKPEIKKRNVERKTPRSTKAQVYMLREAIKDCLVKQMSTAQIIRFVSTQPILDRVTKSKIDKLPADEKKAFIAGLKRWDLCDKQIGNHIEKAWTQLLEEVKPKINELRTRQFMATRQIIQECMMIKDFRGAIRGMEHEAKLFGLEAPQQLALEANVTQTQGTLDFKKLTVKELKELRELMKKAKKEEVDK